MVLRKALEKLNDDIKDLSSLHVQTFTGQVKFTAVGDSDDNIKYDNIKTAVESAQNAADIKLVAESLYKFDGDSYNFLISDENGISASAMELHKSAVEGGIKTRQALAELIVGFFN